MEIQSDPLPPGCGPPGSRFSYRLDAHSGL